MPIDIPRVTETLDMNEAPFEEVSWDVDDDGESIILVACKSPTAARQCARALQNDDELDEIWIAGSFVEVAV